MPAASPAARRRSVGLVVHEIGDPYFSEIASGVLRVRRARGADRCRSATPAATRSASSSRSACWSPTGSARSSSRARASSTPPMQAGGQGRPRRPSGPHGGRVAVIGRHHLGVDAVLPDNHAGGASAVAGHLLDLGHRRIAVVTGSRSADHGRRPAGRRRGGASPRPGCASRTCRWSRPSSPGAGGKQAAEEVLAEHPDVDRGARPQRRHGDRRALGAARPAASRCRTGCRWPGFDDVAVAGDLAPVAHDRAAADGRDGGAGARCWRCSEPVGAAAASSRSGTSSSCATRPRRRPHDGGRGSWWRPTSSRARSRRRASPRGGVAARPVAACPTPTSSCLPVADGGDGTLDAAIAAGFERVPVTVAGPDRRAGGRRRTRAGGRSRSSRWPTRAGWCGCPVACRRR